MNAKKVGLFVGLVCLQSWFVAAILYGFSIPYTSGLAVAMIAIFYMSAPAIAAFSLQRTLYPEHYATYGLQFEAIRPGKILGFSAGLFLTFVLLFLGTIYIGGNVLDIEAFGKLDFTEAGLLNSLHKITKGSIALSEGPLPVPPIGLLIAGLIGGIISGFTINLPFMFGEEYGWRGFMVYETRTAGFWLSNVLIGTAWGLWHAPIILQGHNYPDYPVEGVGVMTLFCIASAFMFTYVRVKSGSIVAACGLHGMFNATGALLLLFIQNGHSLVAHPAGLAGILACTVIALGIFILDKPFIQQYSALLAAPVPNSDTEKTFTKDNQ